MHKIWTLLYESTWHNAFVSMSLFASQRPRAILKIKNKQWLLAQLYTEEYIVPTLHNFFMQIFWGRELSQGLLLYS